MNIESLLLIVNPFLNPVFLRVLSLIAYGFVIGLGLIWVLNGLTFKGIWKSKVGNIYLGWVILIPLYTLGLSCGWITGMVVLFFFMSIASKEIITISKIPKVYRFILVVLALVTIVVAGLVPNLFAVLPFVYFAVLTFVTVRCNDADQGFYNTSVALYAAIWVIFGLAHIELLAHLNGTIDKTSALLFVLVFSVTLSDIGAYVFGKLFEKVGFMTEHKIASNISPNKTYGGIVGHIFGAALGIWTMWFAIAAYLPLYQWIIIAVLIGVAGSIGGLVNSTFKRFYKVKDSGELLKGHGGALDRIDSTIMVAVVMYYYLSIFI